MLTKCEHQYICQKFKPFLMLRTTRLKTASIVAFVGFTFLSFGQKVTTDSSPLAIFTKREKGIEIVQKDSLFSMRFQFRMQNRAGYTSVSENDFTPENFEFRVRRLRMAMRGFVYSSKFTYYIQLSFSRGDMDWESTNSSSVNTSPNIVRDAMVFYEPVKGLKFGFGQTKLPGNRQRVTSSGNLQFADRSIVNSTFTLDRDFGFFATYEKGLFRLKGAITSGEGRNSTKSNKGLNYTARAEFLPLGKFTGDNEDWEGDLAREAKPKLIVAVGYNQNSLSVRQGGTLGNDLYSPVTVENLHADVQFKYKGWSFLQEYTNRIANDPISVKEDDPTKIKAVYVGFGGNTQLSYNFKNNFEIAARYAFINPSKTIYDNATYTSLNEKRQEQYVLGVSKYLYGHRLKIQGNVLYNVSKDLKNIDQKAHWGAMLQVELGI